MTNKEIQIQSIITEQKERSKQYIVVSSASLFVLTAAINFLPFRDTINPITYSILNFGIFAIFVGVSVFWYLAIKPSTHLYKEVISYAPKPMTNAERLTRVNEIFEAVNLYEDYINQSIEKHDLSELESFISVRRDVFPTHHEFSSKSDKNINLSSEVSRKLFITALSSIKNGLEVEQNTPLRDKISSSVSIEDKRNKNDAIALGEKFTDRLQKEIEQLTRGANIYITFGSAITVGAAAILFYTVTDLSSYFNSPFSDTKTALTSTDWFSVISRFSIVVFVEVFAFYYLRLYRSTMDTVKYYQNEITNIEMRLMAIYSLQTLATPDSVSASTLISSLSNSERNFVIQKGQTTVDLEKQKIDSTQISSIFDGITKLTKVVRK
ncbi:MULTISPECIES: hypothetical protein [Aeromonas]|uniref:Uncharacterized protein n=1 Tax=Aeromonas veronii TaxID=654 RepID=A0A4S5C147_AERVE|nr:MULTISPECIES: hypothetical protein [Aeromonas]THJ39097.1 hypothetical protein E8Q35_20955 [Aeromonas veronii]